MDIVKAESSDLLNILELQYEAYQSEAEIYGEMIPPLKQTIGELEEEFKEGIILKAAVHGEIVGSVRAKIQDEVCLIGKLIVKPRYQNQGIGQRLMKAIEEAHGHLKRIELFTGHKSTRNLALYHKLGYRIYKEEEVNEDLTMVYMYKEV